MLNHMKVFKGNDLANFTMIYHGNPILKHHQSIQDNRFNLDSLSWVSSLAVTVCKKKTDPWTIYKPFTPHTIVIQ